MNIEHIHMHSASEVLRRLRDESKAAPELAELEAVLYHERAQAMTETLAGELEAARAALPGLIEALEDAQAAEAETAKEAKKATRKLETAKRGERVPAGPRPEGMSLAGGYPYDGPQQRGGEPGRGGRNLLALEMAAKEAKRAASQAEVSRRIAQNKLEAGQKRAGALERIIAELRAVERPETPNLEARFG